MSLHKIFSFPELQVSSEEIDMFQGTMSNKFEMWKLQVRDMLVSKCLNPFFEPLDEKSELHFIDINWLYLIKC